MQRRGTARRRSRCPISLGLEVFGDPWSLLIVRDVMFKRRRTFKEFAAAGEGIATNILADRLQRLQAAGILHCMPAPADRRRVMYGLTPKGADLAPILIEIVLWSARHGETAAPAKEVREMRRNRARVIERIKDAWK